MASFLHERPLPGIYLSKNDIRYVLGVTAPTRTDNVVQANLRVRPVGSSNDTGDLVTTVPVTPDADGKAYVQVNQYLDEVLECTIPGPDERQPVACPAQAVEFWIEHRNLNQFVLDENAGTVLFDRTERASRRTCIYGGVHHQLHESNNFSEHFLGSRRLLTWYNPAGSLMPIDCLSWVGFVNTTGEAFVPKLKLVNRDNSETVQSLALPDGADHLSTLVWQLPCSPKALGIDAGDTLWYYELWVEDAEGEQLAQPYRFYPDFTAQYDYQDMVFLSSLGSWQHLRVNGRIEQRFERQQREAGRARFEGRWNEERLQGSAAAVSAGRIDTFRGQVGFMPGSLEQDIALDLLHSPQVYILEGGKWVRIKIINKGDMLRNTESDTRTLAVDWVHSMEQDVATPFGAVLGAGADPALEAPAGVEAPAGLAYSDLGAGDNPGTQKIRFAWTAGGAAFRVLRYRSIDAVAWTYTAALDDSQQSYADVNLPLGTRYQAELQAVEDEDNTTNFFAYPEINLE